MNEKINKRERRKKKYEWSFAFESKSSIREHASTERAGDGRWDAVAGELLGRSH